jgi:hypothetical protein
VTASDGADGAKAPGTPVSGALLSRAVVSSALSLLAAPDVTALLLASTRFVLDEAARITDLAVP